MKEGVAGGGSTRLLLHDAHGTSTRDPWGKTMDLGDMVLNPPLYISKD